VGDNGDVADLFHGGLYALFDVIIKSNCGL